MPVDDFTGGDMLVGGGMLELNAILTKHRHVIEAKEKVSIDLNLDGQTYGLGANEDRIDKMEVTKLLKLGICRDVDTN